MKILLLDLDGVANRHRPHDNGYCGLDADKLDRLGRVVARTGCKIVLASAWRYMILGGDVTLKGFGHLLATYGAPRVVCDALFSFLPADRDVTDPFDRGRLAVDWLAAHRRHDTVDAVAALDDGGTAREYATPFDLGYEYHGIRSFMPHSSVGLTEPLADQVISYLNSDCTVPGRVTSVSAYTAEWDRKSDPLRKRMIAVMRDAKWGHSVGTIHPDRPTAAEIGFDPAEIESSPVVAVFRGPHVEHAQGRAARDLLRRYVGDERGPKAVPA